MTNISIIIPIHELKSDYENSLFRNALTSVTKQTVKPDEIIIVIPKDDKNLKDGVNKAIKETNSDISTRIVENDGETDFQSQLNKGVNECNTEWFSLLEFDDEISTKWIENVIKYKNSHTDVELFLPIVIDINESNEFLGLTNEVAWANSFSDELGILDNNALLSFQNFNIDGMVMKCGTFIENGGLKRNMKLTFIYEFLLRLTFKGTRLMVIPRFGYKHLNQRENSLFFNYKKTMLPNEANFWLNQAKKEYYFVDDREIIFTEN
jgi:cell division protein FtsB